MKALPKPYSSDMLADVVSRLALFPIVLISQLWSLDVCEGRLADGLLLLYVVSHTPIINSRSPVILSHEVQ